MKRKKLANESPNGYPSSVAVGLFCLVTLSLVSFIVLITNLPIDDGKRETKANEKYLELRSRMVKTNVYPGVTPVHIWGADDVTTNHHCTGGLFTDKHDGKKYILTCGHAFWNTTSDKKPIRYYYQILQPYSITLYPINSLQVISQVEEGKADASRDVILCIPGDSAVIESLDNAEQHNGYRDFAIEFSRQPRIQLRSTVTGERVEFIGTARFTSDGTMLSVLDYPGFEGESGTIFVGDNNELYIMSRTIVVTPQLSKILDIPIGHKRLTLCSMVKFNN